MSDMPPQAQYRFEIHTVDGTATTISVDQLVSPEMTSEARHDPQAGLTRLHGQLRDSGHVLYREDDGSFVSIAAAAVIRVCTRAADSVLP